jgi:apolipoprotein N-acyltransferase
VTQNPAIFSESVPNRSRYQPRQAGLRLALLSGLLLWLAHPPFGLFPLAWFALIPLLLSVARAKHARQALWRGYVFGWAFLGTTWYWIGLTINAWTGSWIGWIAWFGLTLILAGWYALWAGLAWRMIRRTEGIPRIVGLAAWWVVMEWARTLGTLTMPWAQLSYSQYKLPALFPFVDMTGAYGLSFLILLVNAAIAEQLLSRNAPQSFRTLQFAGGTCALFLLIGLLHPVNITSGRTVPIAAMQGNFPMITRPEEMPAIMETFRELTQQAEQNAVQKPELYVWSESAAPDDALNNFTVRTFLQSLSDTHNAAILTGTRSEDSQTHAPTNSAALFVPQTQTPLRYDKVQLVPFGEFIPFRGVFPTAVSQAFEFFEKDVESGRAGDTLRNGDLILGAFICYESMYPNYAARMSLAGANVLVTQSNDAWFQSRAAMEQHLSAVVFRAAENRKWVVRSTTNGITAFLDERGRIVKELDKHKAGFLIESVPLRPGTTLYARFGDWFVLVCGALTVFTLFASRNAQGSEERRNNGKQEKPATIPNS